MVIPLLHFEPDPEHDNVGGIVSNFVIEYHGIYYHCQLSTGTYTSSGEAAPPFSVEILYHRPIEDHRTFQGYASYEEARDLTPAAEPPKGSER